MQRFPTAPTQFHSILAMLQLMDQEMDMRQRERSPRKGAEPAPNKTRHRPKDAAPQAVAPRRGAGKKPAPRFRFNAKVILHRNDRYVKGRALNISRSGIFMASGRKLFQENEVVRIAIKPHGMARYYKAVVRVVRFNGDSRSVPGYGLQFVTSQR